MGARERRLFDASHHCAAWRFRDGRWRAIDAGEPAGSAGPPILAAIDAESLVDVAVVVTRYFGGRKLGVGGLARAYGEAAALALANAPRRRGLPAARVAVRYEYEQTAAVMRAVESCSGREIQHGFGGSGHPEIELSVPLDRLEQFTQLLREYSSGSVEAELRGERVVFEG